MRRYGGDEAPRGGTQAGVQGEGQVGARGTATFRPETRRVAVEFTGGPPRRVVRGPEISGRRARGSGVLAKAQPIRPPPRDDIPGFRGSVPVGGGRRASPPASIPGVGGSGGT